MSFTETLQQGKVGESEIAAWLRNRGKHVLPVYEIADNQYKGPAIYSSNQGEIIAPDILAFNSEGIVWIEAKHKNAFSFHRITGHWVTGIDIRHYEQYLKVADIVDWPVWILFLQRGGTAKDSPKSDAGLYGNDIKVLRENEHHRHANWGKSGMVYWEKDFPLIKLSDYPL